jgi:predicted permease
MNHLDFFQSYVQLSSQLLPVIVCALIGAYWSLSGKEFPSEFVSNLSISLATPSLVFYTLVSTKLDNTLLLKVGGSAVLCIFLMAMIAIVLLKLFKLPIWYLLPCATFPNAGNLGLPMAQLSFGDDGLVIAVAFFAIFSFFQHTLGVSILGWANHKDSKQNGKFPYGVAFMGLSAVILRAAEVKVPGPILESTKLVGSLAIPLMLISLGVALCTIQRSSFKQGAVLAAVRMLTGAIGGSILVYSLDLPPLACQVFIQQMLMPIAVVNYIYTQRLTPYGQTAAAGVLVSTVIFALLAPMIVWWTSYSLIILK